MREVILNKFPTVFRDTITEVPMNGKPVHIHVKPNAVPFRISVARQMQGVRQQERVGDYCVSMKQNLHK